MVRDVDKTSSGTYTNEFLTKHVCQNSSSIQFELVGTLQNAVNPGKQSYAAVILRMPTATDGNRRQPTAANHQKTKNQIFFLHKIAV